MFFNKNSLIIWFKLVKYLRQILSLFFLMYWFSSWSNDSIKFFEILKIILNLYLIVICYLLVILMRKIVIPILKIVINIIISWANYFHETKIGKLFIFVSFSSYIVTRGYLKNFIYTSIVVRWILDIDSILIKLI